MQPTGETDPLHLTREMQTKPQQISLHTHQNGHHKEDKTQQVLVGCGDKETLIYCQQKCKVIQSLRRTEWRFLKLKTEYDTTQQSYVWVYLHEGNKITISRRYKWPTVGSSIVYSGRLTTTTQVAAEGEGKKLSSHKKGGDPPVSQQDKWTLRALY